MRGADLNSFVGQKFNKLLIIRPSDKKRDYKRFVVCLCDCGNEATVQLDYLKSGHTKSCGCHNIAMLRKPKSHGMSYTTEYKSYRKMLERCYDPKEIGYKNYGGRGIKVCDRWRESFENFFEDMGMKPTPRHQIERQKTDEDYTPENCRWATQKEQNNNRTNNTKYEYNGVTMTQAQWAEKLGVPYGKIIMHMKNGFSFKQIADYIIKNGGDKIIMKGPSRKWWPRKNKVHGK